MWRSAMYRNTQFQRPLRRLKDVQQAAYCQLGSVDNVDNVEDRCILIFKCVASDVSKIIEPDKMDGI